MAKYLKITPIQGNDLYIYDARYQENSLAYNDLIYSETINSEIIKSVKMDGENTFLFIKDVDFVPSISSVMIRVKFNSNIYDLSFGLFGYGTNNTLINSWGCFVDGEDIKIQTSNGLNTFVQTFETVKFNSTIFTPNVYHDIVVVSSNDSVKFYLDGILRDSMTIVSPLVADVVPDKIYFGNLGEINSYNTISGYIREVGIWKRELNEADIYELTNQFKIEDHPGLISTNKYIQINEGKLYYDGIVHNIPSAGIYITCSGTENIDLVISEQIYTEDNDIDLRDTSVGYYNFGKPGAHRVSYTYQIVRNYIPVENDTNIVITLLTYINGELVFDLLASQNKKTEDTGGSSTGNPEIGDLSYLISSKLAEAIRDINGNFIVEGLDTTIEDLGDDGFNVSVLSGKYYINGVKKSLDESVSFIVDKNYQTYSIDGEIVKFQDIQTPYIFSYQPLANNFDSYNAIRSFVMPVKVEGATLSKSDDLYDVISSAGSVVKLYSVLSGSVEYFDIEISLVELEGNNLKWLNNLNKPASGSTVTVTYSIMENLTENVDFFRAIGNVYTTQTINFNGQGVIHLLLNTPRYLINVQASTDGTNADITSKTKISNNGIIITDGSGLSVGTTVLTIKYSFVNNSYFNDKSSIFFTATKNYDSTLYGYIEYDYYLNEIYTIGVSPDNVFDIYSGIPGTKETMVKASLSSDILPISDIIINPIDDSSIVTKYNWIRNPISNVVSTYNRLDRIENTILLSELENKAASLSDPLLLKGTFVDTLTDYVKSDIFHDDYSCFIDLIESEKGCSSGLDKTFYRVQPEVITGYNKYKEIATMNNSSANVIQNRIECTEFMAVNANNSAKTLPEITSYNSYDYISEKNSYWLQKMIDNILFNYQAIIPSNTNATYYSSLNISSNYTGDTIADDKNHSSVIQTIISNMEKLLGLTTDYYLGEKWIVFIGKGFNSLENNIRIKINSDIITNISPVTLEYVANIQKYRINSIQTIGGDKVIYLNPSDMTEFSGWSVSGSNITANQYGEFIVFAKINSPTTYSSVKYTGLYETEFLRNGYTSVKIKTNLSGISNKLNGIVKNGKRTEDSIFTIGEYSSSTTPSIAQLFRVGKNITLDRIQLVYNGDIATYSYIEIRTVENGLPSNIILTRERIKNTTNKFLTVIFSNKVFLETNKDYALCICDNGSSHAGISTIGQTSALYATLKGYSTVNYQKVKTNLYDATSKLLINNSASFTSPSYSIKNNSELAFDLYAIDVSSLGQLSDDSYYSTISFGETTFDTVKYFFNFMCDFSDTYGDYTDVEFTYMYKKSASDSYSSEYKFNPYSLVNVPNGIKSIKFKTYLKTLDKNVSPQVHLYPLLTAYSYKSSSDYISKSFELYDNNADNVKIFFETYIPNECGIRVYVSPDDSRTWREATLTTDLNDLVVSSDGRYVSYAYDHYFRLIAPSLELTSLSDDGSISGINYYKISAVDVDGIEIGSNLITTENLSNKVVNLSCTLDPNAYGFKVYRGNNASVLSQIYDSTARTKLVNSIDTFAISLNSEEGVNFPYTGYIRIDNEIIHYGSRTGNVLGNLSRAQKNSILANHAINADIYLWDFGTINSNKYDGQIPMLSSDFEFVFSDGIKSGVNPVYMTNSAKVFSVISNNTNIYPKRIKIKIHLTNNINKTSPYIKKLICNALA